MPVVRPEEYLCWPGLDKPVSKLLLAKARTPN